jgi:hypothetical protein
MIKFYFLITTLFLTCLSFGQNDAAYISEINYTGSSKGIEISGNGETDLSGWSLVFYEGTNEKVYLTIDLTQTLINNILWVDVPSISFGHPKGAAVALINNIGTVVEFLSYKGSFVAKNGPVEAANFTIQSEDVSGDIGIVSADESLQKVSNPKRWIKQSPTPGIPNSNRSLGVVKNQIEGFNVYPNPVKNGKISISTKSSSEKNVVIYSILGSVVYQKNVRTNETINVHNLNTGLYFIQVEEKDKISVRKILIN